jgi:hypothetical protein
MDAEAKKSDPGYQPHGATSSRSNGNARISGRDFARRAKAAIAQLPMNLNEHVKRNPYATLGVAVALGAGAGLLLGHRILRTVLTSVASYAAIEIGRELGRAYLRARSSPANGGRHVSTPSA